MGLFTLQLLCPIFIGLFHSKTNNFKSKSCLSIPVHTGANSIFKEHFFSSDYCLKDRKFHEHFKSFKNFLQLFLSCLDFRKSTLKFWICLKNRKFHLKPSKWLVFRFVQLLVWSYPTLKPPVTSWWMPSCPV